MLLKLLSQCFSKHNLHFRFLFPKTWAACGHLICVILGYRDPGFWFSSQTPLFHARCKSFLVQSDHKIWVVWVNRNFNHYLSNTCHFLPVYIRFSKYDFSRDMSMLFMQQVFLSHQEVCLAKNSFFGTILEVNILITQCVRIRCVFSQFLSIVNMNPFI